MAVRRLYAPGRAGAGAGAGGGADVAAPEPPDDRIDLNAAGASELQRLPGIGPVGARRIVEEREAGGPVPARSATSSRVAGFGPSRVRGLSGRVRAEGADERRLGREAREPAGDGTKVVSTAHTALEATLRGRRGRFGPRSLPSRS